MIETGVLIAAIGGLASAIGILFKKFADIVERSEKRSQEEIQRIMDVCEERLESEKEARITVTNHMDQFGATLKEISVAITDGNKEMNCQIKSVAQEVKDLSIKVEKIEKGHYE